MIPNCQMRFTVNIYHFQLVGKHPKMVQVDIKSITLLHFLSHSDLKLIEGRYYPLAFLTL